MNNRNLTAEEMKQILEQVKNRLLSESMVVKNNIEGREISIVNEEISKKSGGVMISKKDANGTPFLGDYYSLDDLLMALDTYVSAPKEEKSKFSKKSNVVIDRKAVDTALKTYSSFYVEKNEKAKSNASFYTVFRSNNNEDDYKTTGGLITKNGTNVKEGEYVDEMAAKAILGAVKIEEEKEIIPPVPPRSREPIPPLPKEAPKKEEPKKDDKETTIVTTIPIKKPTLVSKFVKKFVPDKKKKELKDLCKKLISFGILLPMFLGPKAVKADKDKYIKEEIEPKPQVEEIIVDDNTPIPEIVPEDVKFDYTLENGDVVDMTDGITYDYTSQADYGGYGTIGNQLDAGEYTVDVIALLDGETNDIITYSSDPDASLESLLIKTGHTKQDIADGKIKVRYNVHEGLTPGYDNENAAGWVTYDADSYEDKGNVNQGTYEYNVDEINQGGKSL